MIEKNLAKTVQKKRLYWSHFKLLQSWSCHDVVVYQKIRIEEINLQQI